MSCRRAAAGTTEGQIADGARARFEENRRAFVERGPRGEDIIHQNEVLSAQVHMRVRPQRKRMLNVRGTLSGSQSRLGLRRDAPCQQGRRNGNVPVRGDAPRDFGRLVVAALALPCGMERDGNECC